jgi:hypothetical protein
VATLELLALVLRLAVELVHPVVLGSVGGVLEPCRRWRQVINMRV